MQVDANALKVSPLRRRAWRWVCAVRHFWGTNFDAVSKKKLSSTAMQVSWNNRNFYERKSSFSTGFFGTSIWPQFYRFDLWLHPVVGFWPCPVLICPHDFDLCFGFFVTSTHVELLINYFKRFMRHYSQTNARTLDTIVWFVINNRFRQLTVSKGTLFSRINDFLRD